MGKANNIQGNEIRAYMTNEKENSMIKIRSIDWVVDAKHYPQLEKREFFKGEHGWMTGKAKGFNMSDLLVIQTNWDQILADLGGKAQSAHAPQTASPVAAPMAASVQRDEDF